MRDFDLATWKQTHEAKSLRDDAEVLARATPEQLARLLTICIRQDRFCEGTLEGAFESFGTPPNPHRAAVILRDMRQAPS